MTGKDLLEALQKLTPEDLAKNVEVESVLFSPHKGYEEICDARVVNIHISKYRLDLAVLPSSKEDREKLYHTMLETSDMTVGQIMDYESKHFSGVNKSGA